MQDKRPLDVSDMGVAICVDHTFAMRQNVLGSASPNVDDCMVAYRLHCDGAVDYG